MDWEVLGCGGRPSNAVGERSRTVWYVPPDCRHPSRPNRRNSLSEVCNPSRTISPRRKRTSLMPCASRGPPPLRMSSIRNTRTCGSVRKASRAHFSTRCGGAMTNPVKGRPALCTSMLASAIKVFPAPHSATTLALRASFQRRLTPMIAIVCAGYGLRSIRRSNGDGVSSAP